jgi:hypothetical protein
VSVAEYDVKYLNPPEIKGTLLLFRDRVVFKPEKEHIEKVEIPMRQIKDARIATENDFGVLEVALLGAWAMLFPDKRTILIIDVEDELGIVKHLVFDGDEMDVAVEDIYDLRRMEKSGRSEAEEPVLRRELRHGNWQCPKCLRVNSVKTRFCTRCGEEKKGGVMPS